MYEYQHGGSVYNHLGQNIIDQNILDLSANINPVGFPEGIREAIINQIPFINRYPDSFCVELRRAIAKWEDVPPEWIICGNGASDIIFRLPLCLKLNTSLLPVPIFGDYIRSLKVSGVNVFFHYLHEKTEFRLNESVFDSIQRCGADAVYICNPNNPTGILTERSLMEEVISYCAKNNKYVIVDECFIDFVENSRDYTVKPLLKNYSGLIIIKAFTKIFALPGLRLGYAICSDMEIIDNFYKCGADWPVSNIAQAAGIVAITAADNGYLKDSVDFIKKERDIIKRELKKMGYIIFASKANFVFFKSPNNFDLDERLQKSKIRIRPCGNFTGLSEDYYRAAISSTENNKRFLEELKLL